MKKQQLEAFRNQLRATADRVGRTAASLEEQVRNPTSGESAGGLSNTPLHLGDVGSEAYNQELGATLLENETYIRDETLAALDRIERGTFGLCENCGIDIPAERLEILPYTRHCVPCASTLQSGRAVNLNEGRPGSGLHEGDANLHDAGSTLGRTSGKTDKHAAGTPGGGSAIGGLGGTNIGSGKPQQRALDSAMGSSHFDTTLEGDDEEEMPQAYSGPSGGAVGGTPANKRVRGGRVNSNGNAGTGGKSTYKNPKNKKKK